MSKPRRSLQVQPFQKGQDVTAPAFREQLNALARAARAPEASSRTLWRPRWVELSEALSEPTDAFTDPAEAEAKVIIRGDDGDYLVSETQTLKVTNRFEDFSAASGDRIMVERVAGEWWPREIGGGGTTLTDGCECNEAGYSEGVPLTEGSPTVCCTSHKRWRIDLGTTIGEKTLYHLTDDIWSTFHTDDDLDNPFVNDCGSGLEDEYDVVMELTSTGAKITLEARDTLNCEQVCFEYERALPFRCKGSNQFSLIRHEGVSGMGLPVCLCVHPRLYPNCDRLQCGTTAASVTISGLYVLDAYDHECSGGTPIDCGCHCSPAYGDTETLPRLTINDGQYLAVGCDVNQCAVFQKVIGTYTTNVGCCRSTVGCTVTDGSMILQLCVSVTGSIQVRLLAGGGTSIQWVKTGATPPNPPLPCNEPMTATVSQTASDFPLSSCAIPTIGEVGPLTIVFNGGAFPGSSGHCSGCGDGGGS